MTRFPSQLNHWQCQEELSDRRCLSSRRRDQIRAKLYVTKKDVTPATFEDRERMCRPTMEQLNAKKEKTTLQR